MVDPETRPAQRLLKKILDVRAAEIPALCWSWLYIFAVLSSYYILRPIRDEMGVAGGVENLQWLFTGTLLGMLVVNPPFAALVARMPRVRFIAVAYRFFIAWPRIVPAVTPRGGRPLRRASPSSPASVGHEPSPYTVSVGYAINPPASRCRATAGAI